MYIICYMSQHVLYCKYRRRHFYVICHKMHYIVSNGEDISKLNDNCRIHLLFYYNTICFNEKIYFFDVWLFSQHSFIWLKGYANPEKKLMRGQKWRVRACIGCYVLWFEAKTIFEDSQHCLYLWYSLLYEMLAQSRQ